MGPTRAMHKTDAVMLAFPRFGGSRFFWNVKPFYTMLGMTQYQGCPSKWSWTCAPNWEKRLSGIGLAGQVLFSSRVTDRVSDPKVPDSFLPCTSLSTSGLLEELARWSVCPQKHGGLLQQDQKDAASAVLAALCKECLTNRVLE